VTAKKAITRMLATAAVLALGAAPAALAERPEDPGSNGLGHGKAGKPESAGKSGQKGKSGSAKVMYVFKGTFDGTSSVDVKKGNAHVKRAELTGATVEFDFAEAGISVADVNTDGTADLADVAAGDKVVVKARLPKRDPGTQPFKAKQLVDQTNPAESD
jgi:hypothetical protein